MTREVLQEANNLNHTITDLEDQIQITEAMHHCDGSLAVSCKSLRPLVIAGNNELKDDIIDLILRHLSDTKDKMEDKLKLL